MKQTVKLIVILNVPPVGSKYTFENVLDTLESIAQYTTTDRRILILDNSAPLHAGDKISKSFPEASVIRAPENYGEYGGQYKAESMAYLYVHTFFNYQVLMRMEIDSLLTGPGIEDDAIVLFKEKPQAGQLGTYVRSGEGIEWPRRQLLRQKSVLGQIMDFRRALILRKLYAMARGNGFKPGDHILGGITILNPAFVEKIVQQGWLAREELRRARLQHDHIFSLLCNAVGMEMFDFSAPGYPMACAWRQLPASPEELAAAGKKFIHSTSRFKSMSEDQIRTFFRARRHGSVAASATTSATSASSNGTHAGQSISPLPA